MSRYATLIVLTCVLLALAGTAQAQSNTGSTTMSVAVGPEAALTINTATTTLSTIGTVFADYTGSTSLTYKIRTTQSTGTGTITLKVTTDFTAGGPSVTTPPSTGDTLAYTCTVVTPGTACTGSQTASTASSTPVATFGANAKSAKAGNPGNSVAWVLTNDPVYAVGTYTATVTFTISAT